MRSPFPITIPFAIAPAMRSDVKLPGPAPQITRADVTDRASGLAERGDDCRHEPFFLLAAHHGFALGDERAVAQDRDGADVGGCVEGERDHQVTCRTLRRSGANVGERDGVSRRGEFLLRAVRPLDEHHGARAESASSQPMFASCSGPDSR